MLHNRKKAILLNTNFLSRISSFYLLIHIIIQIYFMANWRIFSLTLLTAASLVGQFGAFAMIKHRMAQELNFT